MKVLLVVSACFLATAYAQHQNQAIDYELEEKLKRTTTTWIPILEYNKEQGDDGSYKTSYKTGNNIDASEQGFLKDFSEDHPNGVLVQHGGYSYTAPDGQVISVQYTADEHGFRATGDHIPTAAPIPPEIQAGLDQIYAGIKLQQERSALRAKTDPDFAKTQEARAQLDYNGQYYQDQIIN